MARSTLGPLSALPSTSATPPSAVSSPATIRRSVDFPQPDAPTIVTNSPAPIDKLTLSRTSVLPRRPTKLFVNPLISIDLVMDHRPRR